MSKLFLTLLLTLSTATFAKAADSDPNASATVLGPYMNSVLGTHVMTGDAGCASVQIKLTGNPKPGDILDYDINIGSNSNYITSLQSEVSVSGSTLRYKRVDYPDMWCGDRVRRQVVITKNNDGSLASLSVAVDSANGCIYLWHREFAAKCRAK